MVVVDLWLKLNLNDQKFVKNPSKTPHKKITLISRISTHQKGPKDLNSILRKIRKHTRCHKKYLKKNHPFNQKKKERFLTKISFCFVESNYGPDRPVGIVASRKLEKRRKYGSLLAKMMN